MLIAPTLVRRICYSVTRAGQFTVSSLQSRWSRTPFSRPALASVPLCFNIPLQRTLLTLAIESSCDDTAVCILEKRSSGANQPEVRLLFNEKITLPACGHGGIHPILALESHQKNLAALVRRALSSLPQVGEHIFVRVDFNPADNQVQGSTRMTATNPNASLDDASKDNAFVYQSLKVAIPNTDATIAVSVQPTKLVDRGSSSNPEKPVPSRFKESILLRDGKRVARPDFVCVTRGPGMRSNLATGIDVAKGLAVAWDTDLVGVHHMQAHALTPRLVHAMGERSGGGRSEDGGDAAAEEMKNEIDGKGVQPDFPFLTLLVSGGHTMLLHSRGLVDHEILASTKDIAIGDALDKCGRILLPQEIREGLKDTAYAKHLSQYAFPDPSKFDSDEYWPVPARRQDEINRDGLGGEWGWSMQLPLALERTMAFSFSGIVSSIMRITGVNAEEELEGKKVKELSEEERLALARTCLGTAFEHLASRTVIALETLRSQAEQQRVCTLVVSGGVAANSFLKSYLRRFLDVRGFPEVQLDFPPPWLCTDNAAMIAWAGMEMYEAGWRSSLDIMAIRKWGMDLQGEDGGILGVGGLHQQENAG